ncbi:MAG TPA: DUF2065 domain-containing protein [Rudaea sp.]|jgi:uncharacterized protein YjeT (DUF2065 family)|nr:DUF2065 domain-containing protein [Rudaea sp.]
MHELLSALCLVLVIEGLFLFAAPGTWQRIVEQMRELEPRQLRIIGGVMVGLGVVALKLATW